MFIAKKFKKIPLRRKKKSFPKKGSKNEKDKQAKREPIVCYECKKLSHIKYDYPLLKSKWKTKKKKKKVGKAMKATWDNSDSFNSSDDKYEGENLPTYV